MTLQPTPFATKSGVSTSPPTILPHRGSREKLSLGAKVQRMLAVDNIEADQSRDMETGLFHRYPL